jgi:hypothetical protein
VEAAAGLLLAWLGFDLLRTREGGRARLGVHEHRGGTVHVHLHWRARGEMHAGGANDIAPLSHAHARHPVRRALLVGSLHGVGGSAVLGLLAARSADASQAILYAAVFGLGATAGMLALSTTVSLPLRSPGVRAAALGRSSRCAIGCASIAIGAWIGVNALMAI